MERLEHVSAAAERRAFALQWPLPGLLVRQPALWLAALAFALYLPPAVSVLQLDHDSIEYLDVARHLAAGQGYVLAVKAFHFGSTDVLHNGLDERPPLYPLLVAGLFRAGLDFQASQVLNALLSAGCAALVYAIGSTLFGQRIGLLAGLLAAMSPPVLVFMVPPMTEALSIFLALLAAWLLIRDLDKPSGTTFAAAGAAFGLGYLTRPTCLAYAAALLFGVALASRRRSALLRPMVACLLAMAVFVTPITLYSLQTRGSLSYSGQTYLYAVFEPSDIHRNAFSRNLTSPLEFILANQAFVLRAVSEMIRGYLGLIFLDREWLLFLLPAWPLSLWALLRGRLPRAAAPVLLLAATNFVLYGFTWSTFQPRYQLLTLLALMPFAVDGLSRLGLGRLRLPIVGFSALHLLILAICVSWLPAYLQEYRGAFRYLDMTVGTRTDDGITWTGAPAWVEDKDLAQLFDWTQANADRDAVLAHGSPALMTFFTERPATLLPRRLDPDNLRQFLVDYRVSYVLLRRGGQFAGSYSDDLRAIEGGSISSTSVGSYLVFDTRLLWR